jgi:hypothetical protein
MMKGISSGDLPVSFSTRVCDLSCYLFAELTLMDAGGTGKRVRGVGAIQLEMAEPLGCALRALGLDQYSLPECAS